MTYGDVFLENEKRDVDLEFRGRRHREPVRRCSARPPPNAENCLDAGLPLPAYDQAIKASHVFNLLQARGVISVAERQAYIGRVRDLAKGALPGVDGKERMGGREGVMTDFLLELLSEEIPARMQAKARADLARLFGEQLRSGRPRGGRGRDLCRRRAGSR